MSLTFDHAALKVKNLKVSFKFYHEILGIPLVRTISSGDDHTLIFLQGLELSQRNKTETMAQKCCNFDHIGIEVKDIDKVVKNLKSKGVRFVSPIRKKRFEGIKKEAKLATFNDPDGIKIELLEWKDL